MAKQVMKWADYTGTAHDTEVSAVREDVRREVLTSLAQHNLQVGQSAHETVLVANIITALCEHTTNIKFLESWAEEIQAARGRDRARTDEPN